MSDAIAAVPKLGNCRDPEPMAGRSPASPEPLWKAVARGSRTLAKGELLYRPGDALRAIYLVRGGAFKTTSTSSDGCERVMGFHLPGDMLGLDGWSEFRHRCEAIALADARVCQLSINRFMQAVLQEKEAQEWTLRTIGRSMRNDIEHLDMLERRQPVERIALFLRAFLLRSRHLVEDDACVSLPMSREEIACFLDLAPETVSRGFTRLQQMGAIRVDRRRVEVRDAATLQSIANALPEPWMRRQRVA